MSTWTDIRDKVEAVAAAIANPLITKVVLFFNAVEDIVEKEGGADLESALEAGYAATVSTSGEWEARILAGLRAFATSILGYSVKIVKEAVDEVDGDDTVAPPPVA